MIKFSKLQILLILIIVCFIFGYVIGSISSNQTQRKIEATETSDK